jgi:hypothetical protein
MAEPKNANTDANTTTTSAKKASGKVIKKPTTKTEAPNKEVLKAGTPAGNLDGAKDNTTVVNNSAKKSKSKKKKKSKKVKSPDAIVTVEEAKAVKVVQEVSCIILKTHSCRIGNVSYSVIKDSTRKLPKGVARVLQRANVLIVK